MTLQEIILIAVVAVVGIPSAWRNPTAAALVLAWIAVKMLYLVTGDGLAVEWYMYPDVAVLAVIYCKPAWQPCDYYRSLWHQFACAVLERSPSDRAVMAIFPLMWVAYFVPIDPFVQWHLLWAGAILQFLFASAEPLADFFHSRRDAEAANSPPKLGDLLVAYPAGGTSG